MATKGLMPNKTIADVLRLRSDHAMEAEFATSSRWLAATVASCKRKILESVGLTAAEAQGNAKKAKTDAAAAAGDGCADEEGGRPNVVGAETSADSDSKPEGPWRPERPIPEEEEEEEEDDGAHPEDDVDVYGMKVAELRAELRSRGLDVNGLKKNLQERLAGAIEEAREERRRAAEMEKERRAAREREERARKEEEEERARKEEEEERARKEEEEERQRAKARDESLGKAKAAMDFPGVDVAALESAREKSSENERAESDPSAEPDGSEEGATDVESTHNSDAADVVSSNQISASKGVEMEETAIEKVKPSVGSSQVKRVSTSSSDQDDEDLRDDMPNCNEEESMQVEEPLAASATSGSEVDAAMKSHSKSPKKKNIGQKIMKLFSPSKKKDKSPLNAGKSPTKEEVQPPSVDTEVMPPPPPLTSALKQPPAAPFAQDAAKAEPVKKVKLPEVTSTSNSSSLLKTPAVCAKPPTKSSNSGGSTSTASSTFSAFSKSTETKKKAMAEARRVRLAEMRGKSKPVELTKSQKAKLATADPSALRKATAAKSAHTAKSAATKQSQPRQKVVAAASSAAQSSTTTSAQDKQKEEKRKLLAAQMREKAAAAKAQKKDGGQQQQETRSVAPVRQKADAKQQKQQLQQAQQKQQLQQAQQKQVAPQAPKVANSPPKPTQQQQRVLSPLDTYEISDRGSDIESDYSGSEEEDMSPKKNIPKWAQKSNLVPALVKQFTDGPVRVDPDEIFPEVSTCDLASIFEKKKAKYQKRTSSGNWTKDRVTAVEKLVYKRDMGFAK